MSIINKITGRISRFFKRGSEINIYFRYKLRKFKKKDLLFFHLNRGGGNSLRIAFDIISKEKKSLQILRLSHRIKVNNINFKKKPKYIFNFREPTNRFYSIFYARKRARKINKNINNTLENKFFSHNKDINFLCENLFNKDKVIDEMSNSECLNKLNSLNHNLETWFDINFLIKNKPFFIFQFENLELDFQNFCKKINYEKSINLASLYKYHKIGLNYEKLPKLSETSIKNLKLYLQNDYKIYNYLISNKDEINK